MKTETKVLIGIFIFSSILILGAIFIFGKSSNNLLSSDTVNIDYSKGQKFGSDSAKLKLVEYSDLQCPACKLAEPFIKNIREKYKKDLQLTYKHFPLMQHVHSTEAAKFAEYAASKDKFWEIHDKLFETQDTWSTMPDVTNFFENLGLEYGLEKDKVRDAITSDTFNQNIDDELTEGKKIGVDATPTFYLNNKKIILNSYADLDRVVAEGLQIK